MKKSKNGFAPIITIIIVAIIIIGGIYYYITNKSDENNITDISNTSITASSSNTVQVKKWLTYKNEKYGYKINYPEDTILAISVGDSTDPKTIQFHLEKTLGLNDDSSEKRFALTVSANKKQTNQTLDQWINTEKSQRQAPTPNIEKNITLDGESAYYLEYKSGSSFGVDPYSAFAIYTIHNGVQFRISGLKIPANVSSKDSSYSAAIKYGQVFDQMLSTFKFTSDN